VGYTRRVTTWRCVICGCDFDEAQARRRRRHEPPISSVKVQTCSRACEEKRQAARDETTRPKGYWLRRYRRLRLPRERSWRCRECSCSFGEAQTKRRRRGEQEIGSLKARTCSASCRRTYRTRIIRRWDRLHPEAVREQWRRADLKRRRKRLAMKRRRG
jgi:rubredoxin